VVVDLDMGQADDPTTLQNIAQDHTAAVMLLERIARRSSC
jgi:hypothetical protein